MANNILTIDAIKGYFELNEKTNSQVDDLLQVLNFTEKELKGNLYYVATLSDSRKSYNLFFIPQSKTISKFDIIQIKAISALPGKVTAFLIGEFEVYENRKSPIGNPLSYINGNVGHDNNISSPDNKNGMRKNSINNNNTRDSNKKLNNSNSNNNIDNNNSNCKNNLNSKIMKPLEIDKNLVAVKAKHKQYNQISHLNTFSREIEILIRVIDKSDFKEYKNNKGLGYLFNITVMDKEGTQMRVTAFNKVAQKYYNLIKEGSVYEIVGGFIRVNDGRFKKNDFEYQLVLNDSTLIVEVIDEGVLPQIKSELKSLGDLKDLLLHSTIDCLGYVVEATERSKVKTKNGEMLMRKVFITDQSEYKVEFALWKRNAEKDFETGDIILIKNGTVSEFNGRNISASDNTKITHNPKTMKEAIALSVWAANFKGQYKTYSLSNNKENKDEKVEEINKSNIIKLDDILSKYETGVINDELSAIFTIKGIVSYIQHSEKNIYSGCPVSKCKKKIIEEEGSYFCNNCKINVKIPAYYMTLSVRVKDLTREYWIDLFGSTAEKFLNITANEYKNMIVANDKIKLNELSEKIEFHQFFFLARIKNTQFNNIYKRKINVYKSEKVNSIDESKRMLDLLEKRFYI